MIRATSSLVQHSAAVHRRRHRGCGVRDDRDALVERLDDRDAEPFVLARAEEQVRHVVQRCQLLVGHVTEEVHIGSAEAGDQRL